MDSTREQRYLDAGRLRRLNAFVEAQRAIKKAPALKRDISFAALLARLRSNRKTKTFARLMVQGFDAADPARVSARSIMEEWGEGGLGASQPRPQGGYGPLLGFFGVHETNYPAGDGGARSSLETFLGRSARHVPRRAVVRVGARVAVITVPIGVLPSLVREKP